MLEVVSMKKKVNVDVVDLIVQQERANKHALSTEREIKKVQRRTDRRNKRGLRYAV